MVKKILSKNLKSVERFAHKNVAGFFLFNLILIILVLLRFAGYFQPFLPININFVYLVSLVLAVVLLKASARSIFMIGLIFWSFAGFLKTLHIDIWSERTTEYVFQAVVIGIFLLFLEEMKKYNG